MTRNFEKRALVGKHKIMIIMMRFIKRLLQVHKALGRTKEKDKIYGQFLTCPSGRLYGHCPAAHSKDEARQL